MTAAHRFAVLSTFEFAGRFERQLLQGRSHRRQPGVNRLPVLAVDVMPGHKALAAQRLETFIQLRAAPTEVRVRPACMMSAAWQAYILCHAVWDCG